MSTGETSGGSGRDGAGGASALVALDGGDRVTFASSLTIGRHPFNEMVLAHPKISSWHAAIGCDGETWRIKDLGSSNGTTINGRKVRGARELKVGDVVRFAGVSRWRIEALVEPEAEGSALAHVLVEATSRRAEVRRDRYLIGTGPPCDLEVPEWIPDGAVSTIRAILFAEAGALWVEPVAGIPGVRLEGAEPRESGAVSLAEPVALVLGEMRLLLTPGADDRSSGATETAGHRPKRYDLDLHLERKGPGEGTVRVEAGDDSWSVTTGQRFMLLYLLGRAAGGWIADADLRLQLWGRIGLRDMDPSSLHKLIHDARQMFLSHGVDGWFIEKARGRTRLRLDPGRIHVVEPPTEDPAVCPGGGG